MNMKRVIKLSERQLNEIVNEAPFSYLGNSTSDTNQRSAVADNIPYDNSEDIPVNPTETNRVGGMLSRNSWWNRHYGFRY